MCAQLKVMKELTVGKEAALKLQKLSDRLSEVGDDEETLIERGRLYWSLGHRKEAINDYLAAQRINPKGIASQLLDASYAILDFYNKDLYNP